jgi:CHAD domain-containing protein
LLDADAARDLEARLRQLAAELGTVRDNEVLLERLRTAVQAQPEELVLGPVQRRLQEELQGAALVGRTQLLKVMNGRDYAVLIDDLIAFVTTGVSRDGAAAKPAKDVLPKLIGRRYRKLAARAHHATEVAGGEQDEALHSTRKAAKQLRYAAEAVIPAFGSDAKGLAKSAEEVQEVLGEHQDGVVAAGVLRRMALVAQSHADESAFTFGLLVGVEQARAEAARREFDRAWRRSSAKHHLRRLRRT